MLKEIFKPNAKIIVITVILLLFLVFAPITRIPYGWDHIIQNVSFLVLIADLGFGFVLGLIVCIILAYVIASIIVFGIKGNKILSPITSSST